MLIFFLLIMSFSPSGILTISTFGIDEALVSACHEQEMLLQQVLHAVRNNLLLYQYDGLNSLRW